METFCNTEKNVPDISVVVPIFNEEKIIPELHKRVARAVSSVSENYELIYVNDGSSDGSMDELMALSKKDERVFYIDFSRNFGHQVAVMAGLDYSKGKAVVIIDGDLQDPPELIPEMYEVHQSGYEVVFAQRKNRKGDSFFKKTTAHWFYRILRSLTSIDIPIDTGDFRLIDRKIVELLKKMPEKSKFLRGQIAWMGFRQTAVYFDRDRRASGKTGYTLGKMIKFSMDGVTAFSTKPLTFVTWTGFIISGISFLIILYAVFSFFVLRQTITGWTSLIISSMFIGGVQLISIGIIGSYISRINTNVQDRPLYIVRGSNLSQSFSEENQ